MGQTWIVIPIVQFNSKQIDEILNKVKDLQNLILGVNADTEHSTRIN